MRARGMLKNTICGNLGETAACKKKNNNNNSIVFFKQVKRLQSQLINIHFRGGKFMSNKMNALDDTICSSSSDEEQETSSRDEELHSLY